MTEQNEKVLSPEDEEAAFKQLFNSEEDSPSPEPEAPQVEPDAQPEAKAEEPQVEQQKEEEEKVPRAALVQQRERRRQVEQQLQQANERIAQLANVLAQRQPQPQPQAQEQHEPEYPNPDDPIAVNNWLLRREQERDLQARREYERRQQTAHQETQRKQYENNLVNYYEASKQDILAEDPEYAEVEKQMIESRKAELRAFGFNEQEIPAIVYNDMLALVDQAAQRRQSPAMIIRQMAQLRGYTRKPEPQPVDQTAKLKTVAEGQAAMKTMSGSGVGAAPKGGLGIEDVLSMTDKQFTDFLKKHGDEGFQKLQAGGRI